MANFTPGDGKVIVDTSGGITTANLVSEMKKRNLDTQLYPKLIYVHSTGDDTDGKTYETAYTTLKIALATLTNDGKIALIVVSEDQDMDTTGDPEIGGMFYIYNPNGKRTVWISNTHASATSVMKPLYHCIFENVYIDCGTANNGILLTGTDQNGSTFKNVVFYGIGATSALSCMILSGGILSINIMNCIFFGNVTYTKGLQITQSSFSQIMDRNIFYKCLIGVEIESNASNYGINGDVELLQCATGISCGALSLENLFNVKLYENTININNSGSLNYFELKRVDHYDLLVWPSGTTGTQLTAGGGVDTWGSWTEIIASAAITKPYLIEGFDAHDFSTTTANYRIQIAEDTNLDGTGDNMFYEGVLHGTDAKASNSLKIEMDILKGSAKVMARIMSSTSGANFYAFLNYQII